MFIPIRFRYTYKNYPDAPKATNKSKVLGMINSWIFLLCMALLGFCLAYSLTAVITGSETAGYICASVAAVGVIILIKVYTAKKSIKIDEMAVREAEENRNNPPDPAAEKRKTEKANGVFLAVMGVIIIIVTVLLLPYSSISVNSISGSEVSAGKIYYVENLQIMNSYAQSDDKYGSTVYYGVSFTDVNGQKYMGSFSADEDETNYLDMTGYFKASAVPESLQSYYDKQKMSTIGNNELKVLDIHFRYICESGKNITVDALTGTHGLILIIGLISLISGIYKLRRYRQ